MTCRFLRDGQGRVIAITCGPRQRRGAPKPIKEILVFQTSMPTVGTCKSCGAPIYWATCASTGSQMPVDAEPTADGNVLLYRQPSGTLRAEVVGPSAPKFPGRNYRLSHFVTCPQAARHREEK